MPKLRRRPLTVAEVWREGPPIRVRDLVAITGLHPDTIYQDIAAGELIAAKRKAATSPFLVERSHARRWLASMGLPSGSSLGPTAGTRAVLQPTGYPTHETFRQIVDEFMGLATILRSAVKTASKVTGGTDGIQSSVTFEAWTGVDGYGKPTYANSKTVSAIVERTQRRLVGFGGQETLTQARVMFLDLLTANGATGRTEPIDPRDRITLPDGTTGPIVDVIGVIDPTTERPFAHEVWLGFHQQTR